MATTETKRMTNREFAQKDSHFQSACNAAGVPPTGRQAGKWRRQVGKAWTEGRRKAAESAEA